MLGSPLDKKYFGKWFNQVLDCRQVNTGFHNSNVEEMNAREVRRKSDLRQGEVASTIGQLNPESQTI